MNTITFHLPFLGITEPMMLLRLLVYTAAKVGAQQFIEIVFNSSAGRIVFETYKDSSQLPEVIAKDHGNEETAHYLELITKRYIFKQMARTVMLYEIENRCIHCIHAVPQNVKDHVTMH